MHSWLYLCIISNSNFTCIYAIAFSLFLLVTVFPVFHLLVRSSLLFVTMSLVTLCWAVNAQGHGQSLVKKQWWPMAVPYGIPFHFRKWWERCRWWEWWQWWEILGESGKWGESYQYHCHYLIIIIILMARWELSVIIISIIILSSSLSWWQVLSLSYDYLVLMWNTWKEWQGGSRGEGRAASRSCLSANLKKGKIKNIPQNLNF